MEETTSRLGGQNDKTKQKLNFFSNSPKYGIMRIFFTFNVYLIPSEFNVKDELYIKQRATDSRQWVGLQVSGRLCRKTLYRGSDLDTNFGTAYETKYGHEI